MADINSVVNKVAVASYCMTCGSKLVRKNGDPDETKWIHVLRCRPCGQLIFYGNNSEEEEEEPRFCCFCGASDLTREDDMRVGRTTLNTFKLDDWQCGKDAAHEIIITR